MKLEDMLPELTDCLLLRDGLLEPLAVDETKKLNQSSHYIRFCREALCGLTSNRKGGWGRSMEVRDAAYI